MTSRRSARRPAFLQLAAAQASEAYRRTALSGFLRTRRAGLSPDPSWLIVDSITARRVPGMRREELAWAADISVDYYTKLEQGRATRPSPTVVASLAEALQLDALNRRYLGALASPEPAVSSKDDSDLVRAAEATLRRLGGQIRDPIMLHLLTHDLIIRRLDPDSARVLFPEGRAPADRGPDVSLLEYIFAEPISRHVYVDWSAKAREVVGLAHLSLATSEPTARLLATLDRLWELSSAFRYLWSRFEPHDKGTGTWRLTLPGVGVTECDFSTFRTPSCTDVSLVVYGRTEGAQH
ncbi:helix-turn-helix transcriptional regulator [Brevibacterium sp. 1718]|uniref:helix-turn-helix transcriptional regulator n=1 Tax=Brevibacterium sp. 1718 TaxID=3413510 RepID=UPI003DA95AD4